MPIDYPIISHLSLFPVSVHLTPLTNAVHSATGGGSAAPSPAVPHASSATNVLSSSAAFDTPAAAGASALSFYIAAHLRLDLWDALCVAVVVCVCLCKCGLVGVFASCVCLFCVCERIVFLRLSARRSAVLVAGRAVRTRARLRQATSTPPAPQR